MKRALITIVLSLLLAGCVSKPAAKVKSVASVAPDAPLVVGDCVVMEMKDRGDGTLWRRTIDAEGYFSAPLGQRVKIAGKTLTEAGDLIALEYGRGILGPPRLVLMRCEEYDRRKVGSN